MDERNGIVVPIREVHIELGQAGVHEENQEDQAINNSQANEQFVEWWFNSITSNHNDGDGVGNEP